MSLFSAPMQGSTSAPHLPKTLSNRVVAWLVFLGLFLAYHANWTEMIEGDTYASITLPFGLMQTGKLSFDPEHFPALFKWRSKSPLFVSDELNVRNWTDRIGEKTTAEWRQSGHLVFNGPRYFIVKAKTRDEYVNTFGPIPGLVILPIAAIVKAIDANASEKLWLKLAIGKLAGALLTAGCGALLFLIAARYVSRSKALIIALAYGLASCAWAVSSQSIWQQTINQFLLIAGTYYFLGDVERPSVALLSGFLFGAALGSRVTAGAMAFCAFVHLAMTNRRSALFFVLGGLPVPLLVGIYNFHFFGNPLVFAQELVGHVIATEKTGSPELFQTPLWKGLIGLLASPSRGLLVYSPFLGLSFWGMIQIFREERFKAQRPFVVSTVAMMAVQCKWFDWWGGWAYGYRPWLEVAPFLTLFTLPIVDRFSRNIAARVVAFATLAWGIFVQAIGAFGYDRSWNERELYVVQVPGRPKPAPFMNEERAREFTEDHPGTNYLGVSRCNIDFPYCRYRLWSFEDNPIRYQLEHFSETRGRRAPVGWKELEWTH